MNILLKLPFLFKFFKYIIGGLIQFSWYKVWDRAGITLRDIDEEDIEGKVVIVTGGSSGIGKASTKEFARRGAIVVIGDVDMENGKNTVQQIQLETGNKNVTILKLNLADMDSVEQFAKKVTQNYPKIKILLNNAGVGVSSRRNIITKDGLNTYLAVNYMGHFLLTNLLLENLKSEKNSRVVSMSSTQMMFSELDLDDLNMEKSGYGVANLLPYANTKFCLALFTKELGRRMRGSGIHSYAMCPGVVKTAIHGKIPKSSKRAFDLFMKIWASTTEEAASKFVMYCSLDKSIEQETGKMYRFRKLFFAANSKLDEELAFQLWEKSSKLVNLQTRLSKSK